MADSIRRLFLDSMSSSECVYEMEPDPPTIGEREAGIFGDREAVYEIVCFDPQPFMLDDDLIEGGRVWVRRII